MVPNICAPSGVEPLTTWSLTFCEGLHRPVDHDQYLYTKRVQCQAQLDILVHTIYVDVMIPNTSQMMMHLPSTSVTLFLNINLSWPHVLLMLVKCHLYFR